MSMQTDALARPQAAPLRVIRSRSPKPVRRAQVRIPNAVIGTLIFLGAEVMLFAGMISGFLVLRANSAAWPPVGQPRLPIGVTAVNTLILLISGDVMRRAQNAIRRDARAQLNRWLGLTALLGLVFIAVQGTEWVNLIGYGLTASSGAYGATFYTLIGCHAVHVLIGVIILVTVLWHALQGRYTAKEHAAVTASGVYWAFVVGIWPVLYVLVYLL
jgi:cytochrome c oxidase subunit 3